MKPTISVLIAARKNSKYLAKFLHGLLANTSEISDIEVLVMLNEYDTWNQELRENYTGFFQFYTENLQLGRAGLHAYFNELYKHARGDWIIYFCEDHFIMVPGWDVIMKQLIDGTLKGERSDPNQVPQLQHDHGVLDPSKIWAILPKFDNAGPMNHMLSRAFIENMGGEIAQHGNLDSYLNDVIYRLPRERRILMDEPLFHDFTHDVPSPMSDAHLQSVISDKGKAMPAYTDPVIGHALDKDVDALRAAIEQGH